MKFIFFLIILAKTDKKNWSKSRMHLNTNRKIIWFYEQTKKKLLFNIDPVWYDWFEAKKNEHWNDEDKQTKFQGFGQSKEMFKTTTTTTKNNCKIKAKKRMEIKNTINWISMNMDEYNWSIILTFNSTIIFLLLIRILLF